MKTWVASLLFLVLSLSLVFAEDLQKSALRVSVYGICRLDLVASDGSVSYSVDFSKKHLYDLKNRHNKVIRVLTNFYSEETNLVIEDIIPGTYQVRVTLPAASNVNFQKFYDKIRVGSDLEISNVVESLGGIMGKKVESMVYRFYSGIESSLVINNGALRCVFFDKKHGWVDTVTGTTEDTNDALGMDKTEARGSFADLWNYVHSSDKKSAREKLIANWNALSKTPVIQDDWTLFLFTNRNQNALASMYWGPENMYLNRVLGSGIYFKAKKLKPDTFLEYKFRLKGRTIDTWFSDDKNPYIKNINDLGKGNSFDIYPAILGKFTNTFSPPTYTRGMTVQQGNRITNFSFTNKVLGVKKIHVYLPPNYFQHSGKSYPVIYATDGQMYNAMDMQYTLDAVVKRTGKAFIFVMIDTANRGQEMFPYSMAFTKPETKEYHSYMKKMIKEFRRPYKEAKMFLTVGYEHDKYIVDTVIPFVDSHFRTLKERKYRAYMGQSWGGQKAFDTAFKYPKVYGVIIAQSPVTRDFDVIGENMKKIDTVLFCSYGAYDLPNINTPQAVALMKKTAKKYFKRYRVEEFSGGHNPYAWLLELDKIVSFVF